MLLYNGRFNEKHDFIAMEIIEEQIQLTYSAGRIVIRRNRFGITLSFRCAELFPHPAPRLAVSQVRPRPRFRRTSPGA